MSLTKESSHAADLAAGIASAYLSHNPMPAADVPAFLRSIHGTVSNFTNGGTESSLGASQRPNPAVPVKRSITPEYIICLEDGKKLKMLKRYLRTRYSLSPDDYRKRWGLAADYPMVAPSYAAQRSEFAKKIGLGKSGAKRKR